MFLHHHLATVLVAAVGTVVTVVLAIFRGF